MMMTTIPAAAIYLHNSHQLPRPFGHMQKSYDLTELIPAYRSDIPVVHKN